jgi:hypothetical protein
VFSTTADGASSTTERLRITSAGLVGIGTNSPAYALDVKQSNTANSNTIAAKGGTDGGGYFWETNAGATYGAIGYGNLISANSGSSNTAITSWGAQDLLLGTNRTERLRITSAGLVGIGTSSPDQALSVGSGAADTRMSINGTGQYQLKFTNSGAAGFWIGSPGANSLAFAQDDGTTRMTIDSSGRL